jgi:hypothetical protein
MRLNHRGTNCVELTDDNGVSLLFSYNTCVGLHIDGQGYYRTNVSYSSTTSKHLNGWANGKENIKRTIPQILLDLICFDRLPEPPIL